MALPTNIFLGKAKAPTPQTKKQFSTHKPWDQPVLAPTASPNGPDNPGSALPEPAPPSQVVAAGDPNIVTTEVRPNRKPSTNPDQSQYKISTQPSTNPVQSQIKPSTTAKTESALSVETQYKVSTQPSTQVSTNSVQTQTKVSTKMSFSSIVGLQRRIVLFVFDASKTSREKLTAPIALQNLADACQTTAMAAQGSTRRLEQKGLLHRGEYKNGRGGWTRYELPNDLFQELLQLETQNKVSTNPEQSQYKVSTQPSTSIPSSSSSMALPQNLKTTTTSELALFEDGRVNLSPEWSAVDFSPLAETGFTQTHLMQLAKHAKLTAPEVQDSIHFFAFDLSRNGKGRDLKGPPLNFFMGILRKGLPYAPPENFESPVDESRRKTREFKERKERERQAEEQKIFELDFAEWRRGITPDDLRRLVPEWAQKPGHIQDSALKSHFETNVWPERAQELLGLTKVDRAEVVRQIEQSLEQGSTP